MSKFIKRFLKSKKFEYFLLLTILILSFLVRLYKINNPIADWHSWRQADTASVTRNFVERGVEMLTPRYYDISVIQTGYFNPDGYRFVEFPIFNLVHYLFYVNIGYFSLEVWGRLVSVFAAVGSVFLLYLIGKRLGGRAVGLLSGFFYAFIPYNIYFTRVVLPDGVSVFFAVFGVWAFLEFIERERNLYLFSSAILFSFAILVKPFALFYGLPIIYLVYRKYGILGVFKNKSLLLALDIVLVPFLLWRAWMNQTYLLRGIPYWKWAFNGDNIRFRPSWWRWIFAERVGKLILGVWGLVPFVFGILGKYKEKTFVLLFALGEVIYVAILASANVRHDYYQVFLVPAIALLLAFGSVEMWNARQFNKWMSRLLLVFSLGVMFVVGWVGVRDFYQVNHYEIVEAGEAADKLLPRDALVIAPYNGDTAFLYQTKRWGWPVVNDDIKNMIKKGAQYYVSVNTGDLDSTLFKEKYEVVEETDRYIIINLQEEKGL